MKFLREKKTRVAFVATLAILMPLAFGSGPSSAAFVDRDGTSSGLERRDPTGTLGTCAVTATEPPFWAFAGEASYRYPLNNVSTPTAGSAVIEATASNGLNYKYVGPIDVAWFAPTVWDGPKGTMQDIPGTYPVPPNTAAACTWGYKWPVTTGQIVTPTSMVGVTYKVTAQGTPDPLTVGAGTISCTALTAGTGNLTGNSGVTAGSYYSRPPLLNSLSQGSEVVRLEFSSCAMQADGASRTINAASVTLFDPAHGGCVDLNPVVEPTSTGVSHCVSNYVLS